MKETVMVTVIMLTYNHEKWIAKALDGVVQQKTNFKFKLFVHDDCSADNTAKIIEHYHKKYPDIIVPFIEKENLYSKHIKITQTVLLPHIDSKYVALCEGDDFWTDTSKLQQQVDYMEKHEKCTLCFHNAEFVDTDGRNLKPFYPQGIWNDSEIEKKLLLPEGADFDVPEILKLDFTPTASFLYRFDLYKELEKFDVSLDLLIRLVATNMGYSHYINKKMSSYRTGNSQSASGVLQNSESKLFNGFYKVHCKILDDFDCYTDSKFHDDIVKQKERKKLTVYATTLNLEEMRRSTEYSSLKRKYIVKIVAKKYLKIPFHLVKVIKEKIYQTINKKEK